MNKKRVLESVLFYLLAAGLLLYRSKLVGELWWKETQELAERARPQDGLTITIGIELYSLTLLSIAIAMLVFATWRLFFDKND